MIGSMRIGQLAEKTGVSTKAIRHYEQFGVLPEADGAPNGYPVYNSSATDRNAFTDDAQSAGLSLLEIQMILEPRDAGASTVNRQKAELVRTRRRLADIIHHAKSLDPTECQETNRCPTIPKGRH
jgi:MerR family copper efflux transcriptional regulator